MLESSSNRFGLSLRTADVSPRSSPLRDVSRGGRSATQRQKCLLSYAVQGEDNELLLVNYDNLKLLIGGEKKSVIFN